MVRVSRGGGTQQHVQVVRRKRSGGHPSHAMARSGGYRGWGLREGRARKTVARVPSYVTGSTGGGQGDRGGRTMLRTRGRDNVIDKVIEGGERTRAR